MVFGNWTTSGGAGEFIDFLPSQLTVQRTITVPADGAWFWGDAKYRNFVEMDCDHHYRGDLNPTSSTYNPLFTAGELPAPYDVCTFNNCYSCRLDWGNVKPSSLYTTDATPAFLPEGSYTVTVSTLNGGGSGDELALWIAQMNRTAMSSLTMYQAVAEDDPQQASDTDVADRYFIAETADRVWVVPVFHGSTDFPGGPGVTYTAKWDTGTTVTGDEQPTKVTRGLAVVQIPIPPMNSGSHTFTLTATLPGGKTLTTPAMTVLVYQHSVYVDIDGSFSESNPQDQLPDLIPGSNRDGSSVAPLSMPQLINVHVLAGSKSTGSVSLSLENVSQYPGIAMNYPLSSTDTSNDIDFNPGATATRTIPKGKGAHWMTVPLAIRDYAANGTLKVTIPYGKKSYTVSVLIPADKNGNKIADRGWQAENAWINDTGLNPGADEDNTPVMRLNLPNDGYGPTGDNLTDFEEYRGFVFFDTHRRTNPFHKDAFVEASDYGDDIQYAYPEMPTSTYRVASTEADAVHAVNTNWQGLPGASLAFPNGHRDGIAVHVTKGGYNPGILGSEGCSKPSLQAPCVPPYARDFTIYQTNIEQDWAAHNRTDPAEIDALRRATVLHEVGHSHNLVHNTSTQCIMFGKSFDDYQSWDTFPTSFCYGVDTTLIDCTFCNGDLPVTNFNETDTLRFKEAP